jgi:lipid A disaccharide synthetase
LNRPRLLKITPRYEKRKRKQRLEYVVWSNWNSRQGREAEIRFSCLMLLVIFDFELDVVNHFWLWVWYCPI